MPHQPAAPVEADAPRPWARAILHARIPAVLKLLLLALFAAFPKANPTARTLRALRQDWLLSHNADLAEDLDSARNPYTLRRLLQLRAPRNPPAPPRSPRTPKITPNPSRKPRVPRR
jgi:hypothetical protein